MGAFLNRTVRSMTVRLFQRKTVPPRRDRKADVALHTLFFNAVKF